MGEGIEALKQNRDYGRRYLMAFMTNPGAVFIGGLRVDEKKYLKKVLKAGKNAGYKRVVEPCVVNFAISQLASEAGYDKDHIEASNVTLMSAVMGYALMEKQLDDLGISHPKLKENFSYEDVLYHQLLLNRATTDGSSEYGYQLLVDLTKNKEHYLKVLRDAINRAKETIGGMKYTVEDVMEHIDRIADDPEAIIVVHPQAVDEILTTEIMWNEPSYEPLGADIVQEIMSKYKNSRALIICYTEKPNTEREPNAVFKRAEVRSGWGGYLVSNRPNEVEVLANGKYVIGIQGGGDLKSLNAELLPTDYQVTEKSTIRVIPIESHVAQYYRKLWTHGFVGSKAAQNFMILIDDKITAVFGLDKSALTMGAYGGQIEDTVFIMYTMAVQHKFHRLNRLNVRITKNKEFIETICNDLERQRVRGIKTVQMTKHPESQGMRGLMTKTNTVKDPRHGYKLTYSSELEDMTPQEALMDWLKAERQYAKAKRKEAKRLEREMKKKEREANDK